MRIAVFTSEFPACSETFVVSHVRALLERGHEVDVHAERTPPDAPQAPDLAGRLRLPPPMPARRSARVAAAARLLAASAPQARGRLVRSLNPLAYGRQGASLALWFRQEPLRRGESYDVVHCHHGPIGLTAQRLRRLGALRGPLVVTFHGHDANVVPRALGSRVYAPLFRDAEALTVGSRFLEARVLRLGAPPGRVVRIPQGVDLGLFSPRPEPASDEALRLASVARLVEEKGLEVAVHAVARLATRFPSLCLEVAGEGPERQRIEALARRLGVSARIRLLGAVPPGAARALYARAHVVVVPSVVGADGAEEGQGLVLAEAQASGVPVVASAVGGIPESVVDGVTGLLVPQRDPAALAARIAELLADPDRRARMGRAGRAFAARELDRERCVERLLALYARVASRPRGAPPPTRRASATLREADCEPLTTHA